MKKLSLVLILLLALSVPFAVAYTGPSNITAAVVNDTRVDPNATIAFTVGPILNGTTENPVQNGFALEFDGVGDYVDISTLDAAANGTEAVTLQTWINFSLDTNNKGILGWWFGTDCVLRTATGGFVRFAVTTTIGGTSATTGALNDGNWHLVTGVYDSAGGANNVRIYVNDTLVDSGTLTGPISNLDKFNIANINDDGANAFTFTGSLDECIVYNRSLGQGEISYIYQNKVPLNQTGIKTWIDFDTNVLDQSPEGNDGTIVGNPQYIRGLRGKADIVMDGDGDYGRILAPQFLYTMDEISIELWVRNIGADAAINNIFRCDSTYELGYTPSTQRLRWKVWNSTGASSTIQSSSTYSLSTDTHIIAEYNGSLSLYINGVKDAATGSIGGPIATGGAVYLGYPASPFNGTVDELRVYNRTLTAIERIEHINGIYLNDTGLALLLDMDGNLLDSSLVGNDFTTFGDLEYSDGRARVPVFTSINGRSSLVNSSTGLMTIIQDAPGTWGNYTVNVYAETNGVQNATTLLQVDEYDSVISFAQNPIETRTRGTIFLEFTSRLDGYVAGPGSTATMDAIGFTYSGGLLRGFTPIRYTTGTVTYGNVTAFNENTYGITNYNQPTSRDLTWGIPFSDRIFPVIGLLLEFFPIIAFVFGVLIIDLGRMNFVSNRIVIYALVVAVAALIMGIYQAVGA